MQAYKGNYAYPLYMGNILFPSISPIPVLTSSRFDKTTSIPHSDCECSPSGVYPNPRSRAFPTIEPHPRDGQDGQSFKTALLDRVVEVEESHTRLDDGVCVFFVDFDDFLHAVEIEDNAARNDRRRATVSMMMSKTLVSSHTLLA